MKPPRASNRARAREEWKRLQQTNHPHTSDATTHTKSEYTHSPNHPTAAHTHEQSDMLVSTCCLLVYNLIYFYKLTHTTVLRTPHRGPPRTRATSVSLVRTRWTLYVLSCVRYLQKVLRVLGRFANISHIRQRRQQTAHTTSRAKKSGILVCIRWRRPGVMATYEITTTSKYIYSRYILYIY